MVTRRVVSASLFGLLAPSVSSAQGVELAQPAEKAPRVDQYSELSLEELLSLEVVTSAVRRHTLEDAPATVYVVPASVIVRRGYADLNALLEDIPEFEMPQKNSGAEDAIFTIRGITGNEKLIVLLDGVRISSTTGTPHAINPNFSLANVKRVEIVLGPSSALYGADAFSAVVNMVTFRGDEIRGGKLTGSYGQYNTTNDSLVVGANDGDVSVALTSSAYHSDEPNFPDAYRDKFAWYNNEYKNQGTVRVSPFAPPEVVKQVGTKPFAMPTNAHFFNLRVAAGDFEFGVTRHGTTYSSSMATRPEFTLYVSEARWGYAIQTAYVNHHKSLLNKKLELHSSISGASYEVAPFTKYLNNFSDYAPAYKYQYDLSGRVESRATYHVSGSFDVSGGVVYEAFSSLPKTPDLAKRFDPDTAPQAQGLIYPGTNILDASGNDLSVPVDVFTVNYENVGTYAEVFARPIPKVALTAGGRFDRNTRYGSTLNPRAGLVVGPIAGTTAKLVYGEAFYAPSPYYAYQHYGAFFPDVNPMTNEVVGLRSAFWHLANPDLKPEKLRMAELSVSHRLGNLLHAGVNGYYNRVRDLIVDEVEPGGTFKGWPVGAVSRYINRGKASTYGATGRLEVRLDVNEVGINPYLAYTWSSGKIDDNDLPFSAKHTVKAGLDLSWWKLSLSNRVIVRSSSTHASLTEADGTTPAVTDGSTVLNTHLLLSDFLTSPMISVSAYVDVRNTLDARYSYTAYNVINAFADGAPQDPRRIVLGLIASLKL